MKLILYESRAGIHAVLDAQSLVTSYRRRAPPKQNVPLRALCGELVRARWKPVTPKQRRGENACPACADAFVRLKGGADSGVKALRQEARDAGFFPVAIQPALDRLAERRREVSA